MAKNVPGYEKAKTYGHDYRYGCRPSAQPARDYLKLAALRKLIDPGLHDRVRLEFVGKEYGLFFNNRRISLTISQRETRKAILSYASSLSDMLGRMVEKPTLDEEWVRDWRIKNGV